jgi:hypothetical protein
VSILLVPGLTIARITRALRTINSIPSEFINIASVEKRPIILALCIKIDFSRSPVTLVAIARTYMNTPKKTCQGRRDALPLLDPPAGYQMVQNPAAHCRDSMLAGRASSTELIYDVAN